MKKIIYIILLSFAASLIVTNCTSDESTPIEKAETAYRNGRYAKAQLLCDSLIFGEGFGRLNVSELCRLAMLFMQLGEINADNDEANTAFAVQSLNAAITRDADSVAAYTHSLPVEEQGRLLLLRSICVARNLPHKTDEPTDSLPPVDSAYVVDITPNSVQL